MARSKLGFLGPIETVNFVSNLVKLPKVLEKLKFDVKLVLLTRGILVILAEEGTLIALMFEWVTPRHSRCSHGPLERK